MGLVMLLWLLSAQFPGVDAQTLPPLAMCMPVPSRASVVGDLRLDYREPRRRPDHQ